jgi:ribosomal-protein-alanine N-acetyltransferase
MRHVPGLVSPVVPAGRLRERAQPRLIVEELIIRPWRSADAGAIVAAYADPGIQRWHARTVTEAEVAGVVAAWSDRWAAETGAEWAVADEDGLLGRVGLRELDLAKGWGEVAYWVLPAARGRAVAPRAVRAISAWMFEHVGLHRIELLHSTGNHASCRVADKAGFRLEGTLRQQELHADGWHDMHLHARLRDDPGAAPDAGP